ncbi:MAG TPA: helix-turn-helix transcriptional regulator [Thermoanaerobaculia bacterium]|jgi:predicted XRE-type DNA-binding protein
MTAQRTPRTAKVTTRAARTAADDRSVRSALASKLNQLIDARGLSQAEAGEVLGMPQPKISAIRNLKLTGISLERLLQALAALDQHVDIVVSPSRRGMPAGIRVDEHRRSKAAISRSVARRE